MEKGKNHHVIVQTEPEIILTTELTLAPIKRVALLFSLFKGCRSHHMLSNASQRMFIRLWGSHPWLSLLVKWG